MTDTKPAPKTPPRQKMVGEDFLGISRILYRKLGWDPTMIAPSLEEFAQALHEAMVEAENQ